MDWMSWYDSLDKPTWTPSPGTIGLIWSILYPVILISFGWVFYQAWIGKLRWAVALPFAINLVANLAFMPIFQGCRSVLWAAVDIAIVWLTILWCVGSIWPFSKWVAVAQGPYFVWVSIATCLQFAITWLNVKK